MSTVYIETSIISYLRQQSSSQIIVAARQLLTSHWWIHERNQYELVISQYVIDEATAGNEKLAAERLALLENIPLLPHSPEIVALAEEIMALGILPMKAQVDALHIATVAYHQIDYLLTWNCKHIANAKILPKIHSLFIKRGIPIPVICTPEELLGDDSEKI
ncbi:type II toxin-antitoxin system VapC family toxin [Magnetovirga frankeli]|uniref:type II toxin-antitoxin system VapC family toxin n=1 Tax=Magnetovirga frankeli TaxID=947516 RepID=UPI001293C485|nr:type II toxin-antitoxin system VapC family toxin [gamma proteobacterium SS-5]